jgi:methionine synthase / methylenetetrahydrofolate reductase(NADPH)
MTHPFIARLDAGPILTDGAMGTILYSAGVPFADCFDSLNLEQPELIASVHRSYIAAGAEIIETNTYGANRIKLEPFNLSDKVHQINKSATRIAREQREVSGKSVFVAGSIGPTGRTLEPIGRSQVDEVRSAFREQVSALLEAGVDLLVFETMPDVAEMRQAILAAREVADLPIIAMLTFAEDGRTVAGNKPDVVVETLVELGANVIGANCSVGPQRLLHVIESMQEALERRGARVPLACLPNAGWPTQVAGRVIYPSSPEYFAEFAARAAGIGVSIIGGCCGTTPLHVEAMRTALDHLDADERRAIASPRIIEVFSRPELDPDDEHGVGASTEFCSKLGKQFVAAVEIDPPKGLNPEKALAGAQLLKDAGVDAINVADSPMARVRMSALTLCSLIQSQIGIETIVHFTTRDRTLMGIQSELLGAHALGVRSILALTGDPPSLGGYPGSSAVYDIDSTGLIRLLDNMNQGMDATGSPIGAAASFSIGCAVDPTRADLHHEAERLRNKIEAGAHFVMTQPIFDPEIWQRFLSVYSSQIDVPVVIGILPLQSIRHAEFLHNEVPGITLTQEAIRRMREAGPNGRSEGIAMAQELLLALKPMVQGVYLMPSFGRYEVAAEVLSVIQAPAI